MNFFIQAVALAAANEDTNGLELIPQHTVHPPFLNQYWRIVRGGLENENITSSSVSTSGGLSNWDFGASTIITNDRISLNGGWFRNINKLHSIFTEGWRVILRLQYKGVPEGPLIFTYSTMKGNYPFMWTEMEFTQSRGMPMFQVKTGGLNVTQSQGTVPLPRTKPSLEESIEVQFLYNRRTEKLLVNVGESGAECLRVNAELEDGYHFGLQNSPSTGNPDGKWYLDGFYFTSLPHYAFMSSIDGKAPGEASHYSDRKTKSADAMHQFIRSREDRDKQKFSHHGHEEKEQESYMQRIAEAQRRRMEMQEKARAEMRRPDPYAADEDDDDDDEDDAPMSQAEKDRLRRRAFDRESDITGMDYDGEYDYGGSTGGRSRYHRMRQKHQVVNPNNASLKPPTRKPPRRPTEDDLVMPPTPQPNQAAQQQADPVTPPPPVANPPPPAPPIQQAPDPQPPVQQQPPPQQQNPQYPPYGQYGYGQNPPPPPQYYGNQGGYRGQGMPPPPQYPPQQPGGFYAPPPQQPNQYGQGFQQYGYRQ